MSCCEAAAGPRRLSQQHQHFEAYGSRKEKPCPERRGKAQPHDTTKIIPAGTAKAAPTKTTLTNVASNIGLAFLNTLLI